MLPTNHCAIVKVLPTLPPHLDLLGSLTQLGERSFISSQRSDLWLADLIDTSSNIRDKVIVKLLRQIPTQELIDNLATIIEACRAVEGDKISQVYGLTYVGPLVAIVVPYYRGNVNDYLRHIGDTTDAQKILLIKELVSAVALLHSHGIVHGSIHSDNMMVDNDGHAVLVDVGLDDARNTAKYQKVPIRYRWKAPEILLPANNNTVVRPTMAGDMYSLGLTIEEIFTQRQPFDHIKNVYTFIPMVEHGVLANHVPAAVDAPWEIRNIIRGCCTEAPGARHTAVEVLQRLKSI